MELERLNIEVKSEVSMASLDLLLRSLDLLMKLEVVNVEIPRTIRKKEVENMINKYYRERLKASNVACSLDRLLISINLKTNRKEE